MNKALHSVHGMACLSAVARTHLEAFARGIADPHFAVLVEAHAADVLERYATAASVRLTASPNHRRQAMLTLLGLRALVNGETTHA